MPKLRRPDGRVVSVSRAGVEALKGRGYTDPDDASEWTVERIVEVPATELGPVRPSVADPKAAWVEYAEAQGVDPKNLTKAELVERLGNDGGDNRDYEGAA